MASKRKVRALRAVNIREMMEQRARALLRRQAKRAAQRARKPAPSRPLPLQGPMQHALAQVAQ